MLKEKTLELKHNQEKYTFFSTFNYLEVLSMLSMFPHYMYIFLFLDISFFLRDHNGNKTVQLFCAIPVAIDFLIVFCNSLTIMQIFFFVYLYDDEINLPTYIKGGVIPALNAFF